MKNAIRQSQAMMQALQTPMCAPTRDRRKEKCRIMFACHDYLLNLQVVISWLLAMPLESREEHPYKGIREHPYKGIDRHPYKGIDRHPYKGIH